MIWFVHFPTVFSFCLLSLFDVIVVPFFCTCPVFVNNISKQCDDSVKKNVNIYLGIYKALCTDSKIFSCFYQFCNFEVPI